MQNGGGGFGDIASYFMNKNPADAGMGYLDKIAPMLKQYLEPYINAGQRQLPGMEQQYGQMTQDPGGLMKQWGQGFQQDPGYQWNVNEGVRGANQASAAGGMVGTPQSQQQATQVASHYADQNYQNWMQQLMQVHGQGLQGQSHIFDTGFQGSQNLSEGLMNALSSQAKMGFQGADWQNQQNSGLLESLGSIFL